MTLGNSAGKPLKSLERVRRADVGLRQLKKCLRRAARDNRAASRLGLALAIALHFEAGFRTG